MALSDRPLVRASRALASGRTDLAKRFGRAKLMVGATIEVTVAGPATVGERYRWTIARDHAPKAKVATVAAVP